jgi:Lipocalin-like domain
MRTSEQPQWPFVGTWRLVSMESRDEAGHVQYPLGRDVAGQLSYDADGNVSAVVARADMPPFASDDLRRGTDAEVRTAFEGFLGYFGTYSVDWAAGTVTHHVSSASFPNWAGTEQVRYFRAEGRRLALSAPPISVSGRQLTATLVWERANVQQILRTEAP